MTISRLFVAAAALLLPLSNASYADQGPASPAPANLQSVQPAARVIDRDTTWSGTVHVDGIVQILPGATLTIRPGTSVLFAVNAKRRDKGEDRIYVQRGGALIAQGTETQPIVFSSGTPGAEWFGIELHTGHARDSFSYCRIRDSRMGIACVSSSPSIDHSLFEGNQAGVSMWKQSKAVIRNCRFLRNGTAVWACTQSEPAVTSCEIEGSREVGVRVEQGSGGLVENTRLIRNKIGVSKRGAGGFRVARNRFQSNEVGVQIYHEGASAELTGNVFTGNRQGILVTAKASPLIVRNSFQKNDAAIRFEGRSTGIVRGNEFTANRSGLENSRTASPEIVRNRFSKNDTALLCEYSSYPTITENNFEGNSTDIHAGENQSFEWTRNIWPAEEWEQWGKRYGRNKIVARNNYWGEETTRQMEAGSLPIASFFDFHRSREIQVNDNTYRRDEVDFQPFSPAPIKGAGLADLPAGDLSP